MEERQQTKIKFSAIDRLYNLKPYRDYLLSNKAINNNLTVRDGMSTESKNSYKQMIDLENT